ncbi:hypothetical protein [Psychrobacillus sp. BM2]
MINTMISVSGGDKGTMAKNATFHYNQLMCSTPQEDLACFSFR